MPKPCHHQAARTLTLADRTRISATQTLQPIDAPTTDVFCSGHAFVPDGRLLVSGGNEKWLNVAASTGHPDPHFNHHTGLRDTWTFHPLPDRDGKYWRREEPMAGGRWYPSLVTLSGGDLLARSRAAANRPGRAAPGGQR